MDPIRTFKGLNNVSDPVRLGLNWLKTADNCQVTQTGALRRRDGYSIAVSATPFGAYSSLDFSRLYIVDAGDLKQVNADLTTTTLKTGLAAAAFAWTEINDQVFFTNGADDGIILKDGTVLPWSWTPPSAPDVAAISGRGTIPAGVYQVACTFLLPDGRETGASDAAAIYLDGTQSLQINNIPGVTGYTTLVYIAPADSAVFQLAFSTSANSETWGANPSALGMDLVTQFLNPLPIGCNYIQVWRGQIYAAQYIPESDSTAIWASEPLGFHLFGLNDTFISVPGKVVMLAAAVSEDGLMIGTETRIYAWNGEALNEVANYGVIPGYAAVSDDDDKSVLFWTKRGLCRALPFENLTQQYLSVAPGVQAGAAIIRKDGEKHYVVALHRGGAAFNERVIP